MKIRSAFFTIVVLVFGILAEVDANAVLPDFACFAHDHKSLVFFVNVQF